MLHGYRFIKVADLVVLELGLLGGSATGSKLLAEIHAMKKWSQLATPLGELIRRGLIKEVDGRRAPGLLIPEDTFTLTRSGEQYATTLKTKREKQPKRK